MPGEAALRPLDGSVGESMTTRWGRRAVTFGVVALGFVLYLAALPPLLVVAAALDLASGARDLPRVRLAVFGAWYLVCQAYGLLGAAALWLVHRGGRRGRERWLAANFALQRRWARLVLGGVERLYGVHVETKGEPGPGPVLVFVRHASLVDVMLPAVLLGADRRMRLRYVLKRELLWDPCLDVVGQRLPNAFVRRGSGEAEREIESVRRLSEGLGPEEGVLIFPEGTRYTPARRERALARIAASGDTKRLERARALSNVLPPRSRGPLELMERCPGMDVLLMEHVGLEGLARLGDFLEGSLVGRRIEVRFRRIPAGEIPDGNGARLDWLDARWAELDAWVDAHAAR